MDSRTNLLRTSAKAFGAMLLFNWVSFSECTEISTRRDERKACTFSLDHIIPILAVQVVTLHSFGRPWVSKSGQVLLWTHDTHGPENSQHLTDWYTLDHVLHGYILHYLTGLISSEDIHTRFLLAVTAESLWKMLENSPFIIKTYMPTAVARGYSGDSIINSVGDNVAMAIGFWMAHSLPTEVTTVLAVTQELFMAYNIRENLVLTILQSIAPNKVISDWQSELKQNNKSIK